MDTTVPSSPVDTDLTYVECKVNTADTSVPSSPVHTEPTYVECKINTMDTSVPSSPIDIEPVPNPVEEMHRILAQMNEQAPNVDDIRCSCKGVQTCILAAGCRCVQETKPCSAICTCENCENIIGTRRSAELKNMNKAALAAVGKSACKAKPN